MSNFNQRIKSEESAIRKDRISTGKPVIHMTETSDVESRVREIVAKYAKMDAKDLNRDTDLQALNIESLDLIEIIFEVEDAFEIDIEQDEKAADLNTLGEVLDWLTSNIESQKSD